MRMSCMRPTSNDKRTHTHTLQSSYTLPNSECYINYLGYSLMYFRWQKKYTIARFVLRGGVEKSKGAEFALRTWTIARVMRCRT